MRNKAKSTRRLSRRDTLKLGAAAAASTLPLVHMQTAHAAGNLKLAFWSHWVPAANPVMRKQVAEWGAKNKVDISLDFLSSGTANAKLPLTQAAEALSGTGHDVMTFLVWDVQHYHRHLLPVDDVVDGLVKQYGPVEQSATYLGQVGGHWMAVPSSVGSQYKPSCVRISVFKKLGYDVEKWYPATPGATKTSEEWTYDLLLKMAPEIVKAGHELGVGLGQTTDSVDWTGALLRSFGAELVDAKGDIKVRSDAVKETLEYLQKLARYFPADTFTYDDASNNRALISGRAALIFNPPSAWFVARRDAIQVASDCWTFPSPSGREGRFIPHQPYYWGIWKFSQNQTAAKELLAWLMQRSQVEQREVASVGYDIPPFNSMHDFKVWSEVKPPLGTVYNYPIRPWHHSEANIAGYPAPPHIGTQLYSNGTFNVMVSQLAKGGEKMNDVLAWAEREIEGYANM